MLSTPRFNSLRSFVELALLRRGMPGCTLAVGRATGGTEPPAPAVGGDWYVGCSKAPVKVFRDRLVAFPRALYIAK